MLHTAAAQPPPGPALIVPQGSPIPRILPPGAVPVSPGLAVQPSVAVTPANAGAAVTIREIAVDGVTAYPPAELLAGTGIKPGRMTIGDVEKARQGILHRYRGDTYLLTTVVAAIDPQGRLRFVVTEGRIADVKLDGNIGPAGTQVLRFLNRLKDYRPIDTTTLERYLLLAQDVPGILLRAVLRPSADEPGALSLVAQVQRASISGLFTADNRASTFTGPEQALAVLGLNSFSEYGEKTEISLYRTFNNTQLFGQVATEAFIGSDGLKLRVYAGSGTADPSGALRQQNYHGVTITGGFSVSYPIIRSRQQTLSVAGYLDVLESHIDTGFAPNVALNTRDNLRILRLGADYAVQDQLFGSERGAINAVSVRVSRGVPILGSSRQGDPTAGRLPQNVDFTKVAIELSAPRRCSGLARPAPSRCRARWPGSTAVTCCRRRRSSTLADSASTAAIIRGRSPATPPWSARSSYSTTPVSPPRCSASRSRSAASSTASTTTARPGKASGATPTTGSTRLAAACGCRSPNSPNSMSRACRG